MRDVENRKCIGYVRTNLLDQEPTEQIAAINRWAAANSFGIVEVVTDHTSQADTKPELKRALRTVRSRSDVQVLVVQSLDRIVGSASELVRLIADLQGTALVSIADQVDLRGHDDHSVHQVEFLRNLAALETQSKSERTRTALRLAKLSGKRLGRPPSLTSELRERVTEMHAAGLAVREIARRLPISRGSVQGILRKLNKESVS
jgi:DNA invertase Pin-like site-specific DNA recombinase